MRRRHFEQQRPPRARLSFALKIDKICLCACARFGTDTYYIVLLLRIFVHSPIDGVIFKMISAAGGAGERNYIHAAQMPNENSTLKLIQNENK